MCNLHGSHHWPGGRGEGQSNMKVMYKCLPENKNRGQKRVIACKISVKKGVYWQALDIHQHMGVPLITGIPPTAGSLIALSAEQILIGCLSLHFTALILWLCLRELWILQWLDRASHCLYLSLDRHPKLSPVTSSSDYCKGSSVVKGRLNHRQCHMEKSNSVNMFTLDRHTKLSTVTSLWDLIED